jgi:hypothetical protein
MSHSRSKARSRLARERYWKGARRRLLAGQSRFLPSQRPKRARLFLPHRWRWLRFRVGWRRWQTSDTPLLVTGKARLDVGAGAHDARRNGGDTNPFAGKLRPQALRPAGNGELARHVRQKMREGNLPPMELMLTIAPSPRSSICGNSARVACRAPKKLTPMASWKLSSVWLISGPTIMMPAPLTSTSILPKCAVATVTISRTVGSTLTSQGCTHTSSGAAQPLSSSRALARSNASKRREVSASRAPDKASSRAMA